MALKITKGKARIITGSSGSDISVEGKLIAKVAHDFTDTEGVANAKFIHEAFNVANETGLTPMELREQRNSLMDALLKILSAKSDGFDAIKNMGIPEIKEAVVLLAKITESQNQTTITNPEN